MRRTIGRICTLYSGQIATADKRRDQDQVWGGPGPSDGPYSHEDQLPSLPPLCHCKVENNPGHFHEDDDLKVASDTEAKAR